MSEKPRVAARGRVVVGLDLAAVCSPAASAAALGGGGGRLEREKAVLVELLQRVAMGGLVDLDTLCAVEGVAVWSLYCDVCVLQHDGNLLDASLLAMMLALSRVRLPSVQLASPADAAPSGAVLLLIATQNAHTKRT